MKIHFEGVVLVLLIFVVGCSVGSYVEVQGRGLDGKTIEQCAALIKQNTEVKQ